MSTCQKNDEDGNSIIERVKIDADPYVTITLTRCAGSPSMHGRNIEYAKKVGLPTMERPSDTLENTRLWKTTLATQSGADPHSVQRDHLRVAFLTMRKRAAQITAEIPRDQPELTVHDVTHLDALWGMADVVMAPSDTLTPIEAFVLGGAFLVHNLGNGLAAYPKGEEERHDN